MIVARQIIEEESAKEWFKRTSFKPKVYFRGQGACDAVAEENGAVKLLNDYRDRKFRVRSAIMIGYTKERPMTWKRAYRYIHAHADERGIPFRLWIEGPNYAGDNHTFNYRGTAYKKPVTGP